MIAALGRLANARRLAVVAVLLAAVGCSESPDVVRSHVKPDVTYVVDVKPALANLESGAALRVAIGQLPGVAVVKIDAVDRISVQVDSKVTTKQQVEQAIHRIGYKESKVRP